MVTESLLDQIPVQIQSQNQTMPNRSIPPEQYIKQVLWIYQILG